MTPEQKSQIITLRKEGKTYLQIISVVNLSLSAIKRVLAEADIKVPSDIRAQNAYQAKLDKNPNCMNEMRAKLTPDVVKRRSVSIKKTYESSQLRELKRNQTESWLSGLSELEFGQYIQNRTQKYHESELVKLYLKKLEEQKGDKNRKTQLALLQAGVKTSIDLMTIYAQSHQGEYLGGFINSADKVKWKCSKGHEFEMRPNNVQQGQWCPKCSSVASKGQLEVYDFVKSLAPDATCSERGIISPLELDIWDSASRLGIEYNGLFWHSAANTNTLPGAHLKKFIACQDKGVNLFAFFEDEWKSKPELIKAMIKVRMGKFDGEFIGARDCSVVKLESNKEFKDFFETNHLDGHANASEAWGLVKDGKLLTCLSLRKNFRNEMEIARFATDYHYLVPGGAARLLSKVNYRPLYTFSNNRLSTGNVYRKLGFSLINSSPPSYWYTDGKVRIWRFKCRKNNSLEITAKFKTEVEQAMAGVFSAEIFGDTRPLFAIEDYGHRKWVLNLPIYGS
jgi:hypothetical protein